MPYSSEIRVSADTGPPPSVTADITLWEMSTTIDGAGHTHLVQTDQETVSVNVTGGTPTAFSTMDGPDYLSRNNHSIGLAAYQNGMPGPMFRSGRLDSLPAGAPGDPNGRVDVMMIAQQRFTMAGINGMITLPITLPDGNTVTSATVSSAPPSRELTLVASGPYGATTYTYTLMFTIDPSNDQFDLTSVLEANRAGTPTLTFAAGPGGGAQAFLDNLFAGLFVGGITNQVVATITSMVNSAAATGAANAAAMAGFTGGIPAGVVLGARSVAVATNGDLVVRPALGAFGSVIDRFLATAPPAGGTGKCSMATIAGADLLPALRALRDGQLAASRAGRELIALYYEHSPEVVRILSREPELRARARALAYTIRGGVTPELVAAAATLAQELARSGSASLRRAVDRAVGLASAEGVWA